MLKTSWIIYGLRSFRVKPPMGTRLCRLGKKWKANDELTRKSSGDHFTSWAWTFLWLERHIFQRENLKWRRSQKVTFIERIKKTISYKRGTIEGILTTVEPWYAGVMQKSRAVDRTPLEHSTLRHQWVRRLSPDWPGKYVNLAPFNSFMDFLR